MFRKLKKFWLHAKISHYALRVEGIDRLVADAEADLEDLREEAHRRIGNLRKAHNELRAFNLGLYDRKPTK